jgi:hypothetical protein
MLDPELADLRGVAQRSDVEDQHLRLMRSQHDPDALGHDALRHDRHAGVRCQRGLKPEREEVLEPGDGDRDRRV